MTGTLTRRTVLGALAGIAGGSLAACGSSAGAKGSGGDTTIAWYGGDPVHAAMAKVLALYAKANAGAKVNSWHDPFADYWPKMSTQVAGGKAPDVMRMSVTYFLEYVDRGALMDISSAIGNGIDTSSLDPSVADSGKVGGKYYGVGQSSITQTIVYSPSRIKQAGGKVPDGTWTWSDLADFATGYANSAGAKQHGINDAGGDMLTFEVWVRQHGSDLFSPDGKSLAFTPDTLKSWFDYWAKLRKSNGAPPPDVTAESSGFQNAPLTKHLAPLQTGWVQQILFYAPLNKDDLEETSLPSMSAGDLKGQYVKSLDLWSVSANSSDKKRDFQLIDFILNNDAAIKAIGMTLGVPPSAKARQLLAAGANTPTGKAISYLDRIKDKVGAAPAPWAKGYSQISDLLSRTNQDIAFGKTSVDAGSQQFFTQAKSLLT